MDVKPARSRAPVWHGVWRGTACLLALIALAAARPAAAQQTGQDTILTREQRIRQKLRNLGPLIRDTVTDSLATDSLAADSLGPRVQPPPGQPPRPQGTLSGVQRDSIMLRLLELSGYTATEYKSDRARFEADSGRLDLQQNAAVLENGQLLTADSSLTYWERRNLACAYGSPEVSGTGTAQPITGDSLCYNTETRIGVVRNARTTVSEGAEWHIQGDFFVLDERYYGHDAIFTDCDLEEPHYHFAAKDMKVLAGNVIVARNVTMKFGDVPVFWLPFFVQSLERGRQSGLLFPGFQVNDIVRTNTGYERRITDLGFYWAINDYMGAEAALDWYSNNWTAVRGSFDYRVLEKFLQGGATFRRFWREDGGRDFTLSSQNSWEMNERTRLQLTANYASNSQFVRENSFDPREVTAQISSTAGINRRFDWGSANITASRQQHLSDDRVSMTLPRLGVTLNTITLFPALPGEESWFSNATWTASFDGELRSTDPGDERSVTNRAQSDAIGGVNSSFNLGNFSWTQDFDLNSVVRDSFALDTDTLDLLHGERTTRRATWNTALSYQQRLIGTSTLTPSLSLSGEFIQGDTTGGQRVAAPTRINFGANLRTDLFGFWPGVGPVERLRHKVSPGVSFRYSPAPTVTERQQQIFGRSEIREVNQISLTLNQTLEAKVRQDESDTTAIQAPAQDTTGEAGAPRRIERNQPIQVLSLNTSAVAYDFVKAREEGDGFVTAQITNSVTSDLLRGLQFTLTHDLFEESAPLAPGGPAAPAPAERDFSPKLTQVSASFSLNSDSWIARMLGFGRRPEDRSAQEQTQEDSLAAADSLADVQAGPTGQRGEQFGLIGSNRRNPQARRGAVGTWNANFNYSLTRPRGEFAEENQQLGATVSFQPTEHWAVNWNTTYSFTSGEFADHILTLTRSLHDWDANFDFVKTQNGNLSFQFRVALRANRDIKLDYEQRERPTFPVR